MNSLRPLFAAGALLFAGSLFSAENSPGAPAADPIEGKWFGVAEQPGEPAGFGFEIKRDDQGRLNATHWQTAMQLYRVPLGTVQPSGDGRYLVAAMRLELTLAHDQLTGELTSLKIPIRLSRVEAMPEPPPAPDYPAGPAPRWRAALGAPIYAAPAVRDGVAYVGTTGGLFHAVNLKDGSFKWAFKAGRPIHGEALVTDAHVFFVCDNGYLFKLNRADGTEVWRSDLGDDRVPRTLLHFLSFDNEHQGPRPVLADGTVFVGAADGGFHAINANTGERLWRFAATGKVRVAAALVGDNVVFGTIGNANGYSQGAGTLYALNRATGALVWQYDVRGAVTSEPVLVGDKLIVGSRGSTLVALNPADGSLLWKRYFWGSWVESTPVVDGENFIVGSADLAMARRYDAKTGTVLWNTNLLGWCWNRPALSATTAFFACGGTDLPPKPRARGALVALDRATGKVKWRWAAPELPGVLFRGFAAGPALAGDLVIAAGLDGSLYGFPLE